MTASVRYRGQPVSEGTGSGEIYHGDPPSAPSAADTAPAPTASTGAGPAAENGHREARAEDAVRAAFAAVARDRAALAAELRARGQDEQAAIIDIAALIAADPALVTPAMAAVRAGADGEHRGSARGKRAP